MPLCGRNTNEDEDFRHRGKERKLLRKIIGRKKLSGGGYKIQLMSSQGLYEKFEGVSASM